MWRSSRPPLVPRRDLGIARGPRMVFQPQTMQAMLSGADALVDAVRPTLGPLARTVLIERGMGRHVAPDSVTSGGVINRRLIALSDPNADVGAMLLRHALWQIQERAGDGVATAAVLFQAIVRSACRSIAAGCNPMLMRDGMARAGDAVCEALADQAEPLDNAPEHLRRWVAAHCDDRALADVMADILASVGADVTLHVEEAHGATIERELIAGALWRTGWHGAPFAPGEYAENRMLRLPNAYILVSDLDLSDAAYMEPLIMTLARLRPAHLLVVCRATSPKLLSLFTQARQQGIGSAVFVKPPAASGPDRAALLTDMAVLTGARFIPHFEPRNGSRPAIDLRDWLPDALGRADLAWASEHFSGIEGGRGEPATQVDHLAKLDALFATEADPARLRFYRERMSAFGAGVMRIKIGAPTDAARKQLMAQAERLARLVEQVNRFGVAPGAGKAFLLCEGAVRRVADAQPHGDARQGALCVAEALAAPMRVIADNAGLEGAAIIARNRAASPAEAVDARTGQMVDLRQAGILDSAFALDQAVRAAVSAAATFITTDVIVHRRQTETAIKP
ncbi:MAG: TCP-1/cpn60 chaperonin family protein [Anaerolineae bacterium]|nr:hypothetical protein [Thermoflexales bacterium]MDW8406825.1 TCP-1/cpn60 chaperonin family protein [Anaerolineae bacterium]